MAPTLYTGFHCIDLLLNKIIRKVLALVPTMWRAMPTYRHTYYTNCRNAAPWAWDRCLSTAIFVKDQPILGLQPYLGGEETVAFEFIYGTKVRGGGGTVGRVRGGYRGGTEGKVWWSTHKAMHTQGSLWPPQESCYSRGVWGLAPASSEASRLSSAASRRVGGGGYGGATSC